MNIKVLSRNDFEINFLVEGIKPAFAGELRRIMISELPTMAIEWVDFKKNDSALQDEIIANRLGQIPLTYDERVYSMPDSCRCGGKGCSRCQVKLSLKKSGPCMVYSGDLKSTDKSVKPVFEKIPIVELFEDQELQFTAIAQLGIGKEHAKWQSAVVGYKNVVNITTNVKNAKDAEKYVKACPRHVFKIVDGKLVVANPLECNMCMQCVELTNSGEVKVEPIEDSFVFTVESVCGLSVEKIVENAAKILEEKAKEFKKAVKKLK